MSALLHLQCYSSDSENSDENLPNLKNRLPPPNLSNICVVNQEKHSDQPELHKGRIRSFPHERGNWTSFIYIEYPTSERLLSFVNKVRATLETIGPIQKCEDLHLSLSKTFVLKYHFITSFTTSLKSALNDIPSFDIQLDNIKVYCNEDESRTFVSLQVDYFGKRDCLNLTNKIDEILLEYRLPVFYDKPSFHVSILWINGNRKKEIIDLITRHSSPKLDQTVIVDKVLCKIGNKKFQYMLE